MYSAGRGQHAYRSMLWLMLLVLLFAAALSASIREERDETKNLIDTEKRSCLSGERSCGGECCAESNCHEVGHTISDCSSATGVGCTCCRTQVERCETGQAVTECCLDMMCAQPSDNEGKGRKTCEPSDEECHCISRHSDAGPN